MGREFTLDHLNINVTNTQKFVSPKKVVPEINIPSRNRQIHAANLKQQLNNLKQELNTQKEYSLITVEGKIDFDLKYEGIENKRDKICVLREGKSSSGEPIAILRVSNNKGIQNIEDKIDAYRVKNNKKTGLPQYKVLIESIESIRETLLTELWNGKNNKWPQNKAEERWWEVWIIGGKNDISSMNLNRGQFWLACTRIGIQCDINDFVGFVNRQVTLIKASIIQLEQLIDTFDGIVELDPPTKPILQYAVQESTLNLNDFISTSIEVQDTNTRITILDTGVNKEHKLLKPLFDIDSIYSVEKDSSLVEDVKGHGTNVAGVAAFGDLVGLHYVDKFHIQYKLESVRIPLDEEGEFKHLWGGITQQAVTLVENNVPNMNRIFNMSIGAPNENNGYPTSWSSAIDELCYNEGKGRLMTIAAGNVYPIDEIGYIDRNLSTLIDDPAHALNAICVGGITQLDTPMTSLSDWRLLAQKGQLSPFTTTGAPKMAIKPDLLYEAGNVIVNDDDIDICCSGLGILTTGKNLITKPLELSHQTSLAAPGIARCLAMLWSQNPQYTPATIRGLLTHSAIWSEALVHQFKEKGKNELLRSCGYGIPDFEFACKSAKSAVTLIDQGNYKYFDKKGKNSREMLIYNLPWPKDFLYSLGEELVKLKVTLSYFVEPNPKAPTSNYVGGSLMWDMQGPYEEDDDFLKRVNKKNRTEIDPTSGYNNEMKWEIGSNARSRGTIQSDRICMTAAELATCGKIVIYPRKGWWDVLKCTKDKTIPYSMIISIQTQSEDIDLYTEIKNIIQIEQTVSNGMIEATQTVDVDITV